MKKGKIDEEKKEGMKRIKKLVGMRKIIGIEKGENIEKGKLKRIIKRIGIGERKEGRKKEKIEIGRNSVENDRGNGIVIVIIEEKIDVEIDEWKIEKVE